MTITSIRKIIYYRGLFWYLESQLVRVINLCRNHLAVACSVDGTVLYDKEASIKCGSTAGEKRRTMILATILMAQDKPRLRKMSHLP